MTMIKIKTFFIIAFVVLATALYAQQQAPATDLSPQKMQDPILLRSETINELQAVDAMQSPGIRQFGPQGQLNAKRFWLRKLTHDKKIKWKIMVPTAGSYIVELLINGRPGTEINLAGPANKFVFTVAEKGWQRSAAPYLLELPAGAHFITLQLPNVKDTVDIKSIELINKAAQPDIQKRIDAFKGDRGWMKDAGYGIMTQVGGWAYPAKGDKKPWPGFADDFDVAAFVHKIRDMTRRLEKEKYSVAINLLVYEDGSIGQDSYQMLKEAAMKLKRGTWAAAPRESEKIYVAISGSDNNPGTFDKPLGTLSAALGKVSSAAGTGVDIYLRKGIYAPAETIGITPALLHGHRVRISAYKNEEVTIDGSVPLTPRWSAYKGKILQAAVGKGLGIDQLFCNGRLLQMARYPNFDSNARVFNGTAADAISPQRVRRWANPAGGFVHALHQGEWGDFHYRITGKAGGDSLLLEGGWQNNRPAPMHKEYRFVENIFEELDAPGEWYYDGASGMLYLYPPKGVNPATALFRRSILDDIIRINGSETMPVKDLSVEGIRFTGTNRTFMLTREPLLRSDWTIYRGGAVLVEGSENVNISNCTFTGLGGNAVFLSKYNRNDSISHNYIHHIGGNAIAFVGDTAAVRSPSFKYEDFVPVAEMDRTPGPKTDAYPAGCTAYDNLVHTIGMVEKQVAGVEISMAMNITVSHNTIYQVPRSGINVGDGCWGGHMIVFNDVFNTVLETGDHGAFNSWGRDRYWLPGIDDVNALVEKYPDLPLLDVIQPITLANNRFQCAHGWDIDLDDGSSNYRIYNNLCLNGGLKLREGFERVVENNILVNNTFHPHVWYNKSMDVFAHNIVTSDYAPIRIAIWGKEVDSNFFIQPSALAAAQGYKTDAHSLSGNPGFLDAAAGNFTVGPSSKALLAGFRNFPMESFGAVSPSLRRKSSRPAFTPIRTLIPGKKGASAEWLGAVIKNIETLGERSASGLPDQQGVLIVSVSRGSLAEMSGLSAGDVIRAINGKPVTNMAEMLNNLQVVMWQGNAAATVMHQQQLHAVRLRLK